MDVSFDVDKKSFEDALMHMKKMIEADGTKDEISAALEEATKTNFLTL
jgi:hypothetical protein